ncbi:hypothetical protein CDD82_674 [Ophiocordyceps australis]|uniref:Zn(2)-C6 fungal-type domain-containing protein n=1 Tax=Ophiocordyceps australis TaxID=1399860 RepID=A0A2C5ZPY8_9HYPO|nr:hypothetical protein CDD82_674 [Ophiocordyceps australis]
MMMPDAKARKVPARRKAASAPSKIRDSCHACAVSKVKCPKQKPTCARCEKRNTPCQYFITKRPGRKSQAQGSQDSRTACGVASSSSTGVACTGGASSPLMARQDLDWCAGASTCLDAPSSTAVGLGEADQVASLTSLLTPLDDASWMDQELSHGPPSVSFLELMSLDSGWPNTAQRGHDIEQLLMSDDGLSPTSPSRPGSSSLVAASKPCSPASDSHDSGASESDSLCSCMLQALDLMHKLFSHDSCLTPLSTTGRVDETRTMLEENKEALQTARRLLQCSCGESDSLATTVSIIAFKILKRYAAAARHNVWLATRAQGPNSPKGTSPGSSASDAMASLDVADTGRMTAQLILSELHRVQALVNQLSARLRGHEKRSRSAAAFSTATLGQIEGDLRKRLTCLSSEIIAMLRDN